VGAYESEKEIKYQTYHFNSGIYTWNIQYHLECDVCFQYQER